MELSSEVHEYSNASEYLVFTSAEQKFALQQGILVSIIDMPRHTLIPHMPSHMRGVIDYMGQAVPVYDIRRKMGFPPLGEEINILIESLGQRKQDHLSWLGKLKDQIEHGLEISVQTDPHKCAFGLWYDSCKFNSYNLTDYMAHFDAPHKRIHSLAIEASSLIQAGKIEEAKNIIHEAENNELQTLLALFDGAAKKIKQFTYEYAVIFERASGQRVSILADNLEYIDALGRQSKGDVTEEILILNIEKFLLDEAGNSPPSLFDAPDSLPAS